MLDLSCQEYSHRVLQFISTRHAEQLKTVRSKEVARYSSLEELDPAWDDLIKLIEEEIILKNVQTA